MHGQLHLLTVKQKQTNITLSLINVNKKRAQNTGIQKHLSPLHCPAATSETITQNTGIQKHLSPLHCPAAASETISHKTQVYRNISRPFTVLQPQVKQSHTKHRYTETSLAPSLSCSHK